MSNIKVKALSKGFYLDSQIEPGQIFELRDVEANRLKPGTTKTYEAIKISAEEQFSEEWMERVTEEEVKEEPKGDATLLTDNAGNTADSKPSGDGNGEF